MDEDKFGAQRPDWMRRARREHGEGLWAHIKLHQWFTKTTLQGQTSNRLRIMQPIAPKQDHEVAGASVGKSDTACSWRKMAKMSSQKSVRCQH